MISVCAIIFYTTGFLLIWASGLRSDCALRWRLGRYPHGQESQTITATRVERFQLIVTQKSEPKKCSICGAGDWEFKCDCGATFHVECWLDLRRCSTLGCLRTPEDTQNKIKARAYLLWCERGGDAHANWIQAEREVAERAHRATG